MHVLVTGGAGYIGSHACLVLLEAGYDVVVLDNLCNSHELALRRVEQLTGKSLTFVRGDIRSGAALEEVFSRFSIAAVMHFAGLKAVGESVAKPLEYYDNNVSGSKELFRVMLEAGVKKLVFSSSATVYGDPEHVPIPENAKTGPTNPYGRSKLFVEEMIRDIGVANPEFSGALLRYFNPVGAHPSGLIGENPSGIPNNLTPYITQVAVGRLKELAVFGNDYATVDGTGVRDYIHVMDLVEGHLKALEYILHNEGVNVFNLGTGMGNSVLEMVAAFEKATGRKIPFKVVARRPGDIAACYADTSYSEQALGWRSQRNLSQMAEDAWRWQEQNPMGYES